MGQILIKRINEKPIIRFGENTKNDSDDGKDKWYETIDGKRISCNEKIIDKLWWKWIICLTAKRADDDNYTIFEF